MAYDAIDVYLDISKPQGALVTSLTDRTPLVFGPFYQGQLLKLRVYPVVSTGSGVTSPFYSKVSLTNLDLQVAVGPAAGAEAIVANQYTWSKQTTNDSDGLSGYFYANLDLNTTAANTLIGTSASVTTQFQFSLSRASLGFAPVWVGDIVIKAVVKDPGSAASNPTPAASYLTRDECLALFVMWDNRLRAENAGKAIITTSPDQSHTRESGGVDNTGAPTDNLT